MDDSQTWLVNIKPKAKGLNCFSLAVTLPEMLREFPSARRNWLSIFGFYKTTTTTTTTTTIKQNMVYRDASSATVPHQRCGYGVWKPTFYQRLYFFGFKYFPNRYNRFTGGQSRKSKRTCKRSESLDSRGNWGRAGGFSWPRSGAKSCWWVLLFPSRFVTWPVF